MATTETERLHGAELGWFSNFLYTWFHWFTKALVGVYFRAWVINPENLPDEGAVIISPVHRSNLDVPLLGITCKRRARYFAKDSLFRTRIGRWIVITLGGFPVKRDATDRAALLAAQAVLELKFTSSCAGLPMLPVRPRRRSFLWVLVEVSGACQRAYIFRGLARLPTSTVS